MPERLKNTTCGYCSTGCNLTVTIDIGGKPVVTPNPDYPVNIGSACPKGFLFLEPLKAHDRARTPYIRNARGKLEPVDWDTAIQAFTDNLKGIQRKYGRESVAFIGTGQLPLEEIAFLGALAKFGLGFLHGDGNTRQCMATAALAYKKSFGFDAPPFTYKDFEESDVLVFIGANPAIAHPVMWNRVKRNRNNPEIILIDPRKTETSVRATERYRIRPDSLLTFLYGIAHLLIVNNWIDRKYINKHTTGFNDFESHVGRFSPRIVTGKSGINEEDLLRLARKIHAGRQVSFWWTMGVNQNFQGVACAQAVINLALMTGNMGRPGTGANSITGQANAMGSRIFSNTTNLLGGHDFLKPGHRQKVANLLGIDVGLIPEKNGWAYDQILKGVEKGQIKGLWIICTNPAHSWINKNWLFEVLQSLEYLVLQDIFYTTETAKFADLILAAAASGEKEGTFINSERRLGVVHKVAQPPGSALPDFEIFKRIADRWGCSDLFEEWRSPAAAFEILKRVSRHQPCDITGISDYNMIEQRGGIQWPYPEGNESSDRERRLFEDGKFYHAGGKANFLFEDVAKAPEEPDEEYPFILLTGRGSVAQWHTQTRTGKVEMLEEMYPADPYVEINLDDASDLKIKQDEWVIVSSRRGDVRVKASVGDSVNPGELFMPMHYPETNKLTHPSFDPYSREPSYKYAAVRIEREDRKMDRYVCSVCGYVYDPVVGAPDKGIKPGTRFEDLPDDWTCAICGVSKRFFQKEDKAASRNQDFESASLGLGDDDTNETPAKVAENNNVLASGKNERETFGTTLDEVLGRDMNGIRSSIYKERFENLYRVAMRMTSSLNIGTILELIRDEARFIIPNAKEVCLLLFDPEAPRYTRPLHCAMYKDRVNCQLCKRGRETIESALCHPLTFHCSTDRESGKAEPSHGSDKPICELALPINDGQNPLAVLDVISKEGHSLDERDMILVEDLANLARNLIINARNHWKILQEKLTLDRILGHLRPFVPETVQRIVEKNPSAPSLKKQERDVSILFLDVAGYTRISESFTREMVNFIIEKYFSSFLDAIYAYGGDINETAGDGLMAIFQGNARENALNAAHAAVDIRRRTIVINNELEGRFDAIDVNMGINSGLALVGMTRFHGSAGSRMTFTATGPVTNLAARIASAARDGDILVGPKTASRIHKTIDLYDRGLMNLKDLKEEVRVYSLVRPQ